MSKMLLAAEDTTWFKSMVDSIVYLVDKIGWPGAALVLMACAAVWYARRFAPKHEKEIESRTELNTTLKEHIPKQSDTLRILADTTGDISKRVDDVTEEVKNGHRKIAQAIIAGACPDRLPTVNAHLGEILRNKSEAPPGFGQRNEHG